jgi:bifunctional non-homologous end joining protein LigD
METLETVTLYMREGSADKVYRVSLKLDGDKHYVPFEFGRRGSSMQTGDKCGSGASYEKAKAAYDKVVKEKKAKGYRPGPDSEEYVPAKGAAASEERADVPLPMLLTPIDPSDEPKYLHGSEWVAQEKYDGKRVILDCKPGDVAAINRKGKRCGIPKRVEDDAVALASGLGHVTLDGELLGDKFVAFDLLRLGQLERNVQVMEFENRWNLLYENVAHKFQFIIVAPIHRGTEEKRKLVARLREERAEGVVFKDKHAIYEPARRGDHAVKLKFYATASCVVTRVNDRRSVGLGLLDESGDVVDVGNVTVPADQEIPKADDVVECRYLYAYRGGSLYQPVLLGARDDLGIDDCVTGQLKYKRDTEEGED